VFEFPGSASGRGDAGQPVRPRRYVTWLRLITTTVL